MSLLDDIQNIDLGGVLDARAGISASVSGGEVEIIVDGGAVTSALGPLGEQLTAVLDALDDPSALMAPLLAVLTELLQGLGDTELPIAELARAIHEGTGVVVSFIGGFADDPLAAAGVLGTAMPEAFGTLNRLADGYQLAGAEAFGAFDALTARAEAGITDPAELVRLLIDVLSPYPREALEGLREGATAVLGAIAGIALPATRSAGITARLDAVALAAETGDAAAVARAIAELDRVRVQTVDVVRADLAAVTAAVDRIPVPDLAGAVGTAGKALAKAEKTVLELFDDWREDVAAIRGFIEGIDPAAAIAQLDPLIDRLEAFLRENFEAPIAGIAAAVAEQVHALFAHIPVRPVREAIRTALHDAAQAVEDADLDGPAEEVRSVLRGLRDLIGQADLGERIQDALGEATGTLTGAVDGVIAAMEQVKAAIDLIAEPAAEVLDRAVAAIHAFGDAVDTVTGVVDGLDLTAVADEIVAKVREIRETVEGAVSEVPLPEPVRPLITQLVEQLEALNLDGDLSDIPIMKPMLDVVASLELSDTLGAIVHEGLTALREAVANLIPARLIADIEAEISAALDVVAGFNPASLLGEAGGFIDGIADRVESLDLDAIGAAAHAPFAELLAGWDRLRPGVLLEPVITAYRDALDAIPVPEPQEAAATVGAQLNAAADKAGRAATAPLAEVVPGAEPPPAQPPAPQRPEVPTEAELADLRPGDVIRLFGYLPGKLREALAALDAGPAGQALDALDGLIGGLARDLRAAAVELAAVENRIDAGLDALVAPLAAAHVRAQISLQANFSGGELSVSLDGVNRSGPAAFRAEMSVHTGEARGRVAGAGSRHAPVSAKLLAIADGLDASPLADLTGGVDSLLAALDPEPLAIEVDELIYSIVQLAPALFEAVGPAVTSAFERARALFGALNPAALAQRILLAAVEALQEELAVFDPAVLAAELDEVHQAVRATVAAYDPAILAAELTGVRDELATALRGLDPAALLGDLGGLTTLVERAADAVPTDILSGFPEQLTALDEAFGAIDFDAVLESVAGLGPELLEAFRHALDGVRNEIVALLESLRYATARIEAHAEVST